MSTAPTPLTPETVDDLLSAELDGDFETAAQDLGLTPSEARDQLAAVPGVEARRAALARARDLISSSPGLDRAAVDGLVARAMAGALVPDVRDHRERAERRWRVLVVTGSVAAAIAVVVGIGALHGHGAANSSKASVAAPLTNPAKRPAASLGVGAGSAAHKSVSTGVIAFGDVTRAAALRGPALEGLSRLSSADAALPQPESSNNPQSTGTPSTATPSPGLTGNGQVGGSDSGDRTFGPRERDCTATVQRRFGIASIPVLLGTGTVSGRPVEILIFENAGAPVAYVVSGADCSLVRIQHL